MTAPTIEQIFILMQQQLQIAADSFRNVGLAIDADDCEEILAKSKTATPSANTLPLDEVPEGWRFESIELVMPLQGVPHYACRLTSFPEQHDDIYLTGATPAAALRAAIAKVTK